MVFPVPTPNTDPPKTIGSVPANAEILNQQVGFTLKQFVTTKTQISTWQDWLITVDLKAAPYYFTADQETLIKSAVSDLDGALDQLNMTFIIRITGPF